MLDPRLVDATSLPKILPWICPKRAITAGYSILFGLRAVGNRLAMTRVPCILQLGLRLVLGGSKVKHTLTEGSLGTRLWESHTPYDTGRAFAA